MSDDADASRDPRSSTTPDADMIDGAVDVRRGEELDTAALGRFLHQLGFAPKEQVEVSQFPRGFSNLTYLIRAGHRECILRRPPFGVGKGNAHDVVREARVLEAIGRVYDKVPGIIAIEEDATLLGAPFYLMERVRGIILRDRIPPALSLGAAALRDVSAAVVDTLAEIHAIDWRAAGLASLGNPVGYVERQVSGWAKRYAAAATIAQPDIDAVSVWLAAHRPTELGATLVHNDFKFDNVVLDHANPRRVRAVLDWEMVTIGDPLMDLGTTLAYWVEPNDAPAIRALGLGVTASPGVLSRAAVVERYAEASGRDIANAVFYFAFGLFKVAVIAQQIHARFVRGFTTDPRFEHLDRAVAALGAAAVGAIDSGHLSRA